MGRNLLSPLIYAVSLFLFFFLILPEYDAISSAREALKAREALLAQRQADFQKFQQLNRQFEARKADVSKISVLLPANKHIDEVLSSIQAVTSQSGFQLRSINISGSSSTGQTNYQPVVINLDLVGSYPTLLNFLREIEQSLRLYDVTEISISREGSSPVGGALNANLKINGYYLNSSK